MRFGISIFRERGPIDSDFTAVGESGGFARIVAASKYRRIRRFDRDWTSQPVCPVFLWKQRLSALEESGTRAFTSDNGRLWSDTYASEMYSFYSTSSVRLFSNDETDTSFVQVQVSD